MKLRPNFMIHNAPKVPAECHNACMLLGRGAECMWSVGAVARSEPGHEVVNTVFRRSFSASQTTWPTLDNDLFESGAGAPVCRLPVGSFDWPMTPQFSSPTATSSRSAAGTGVGLL